MGKEIEIRLDGLKELKKKFASLEADGKKRVVMAINENAVEFRKETIKSIRRNSGRHNPRWTWGKGRAGRRNGVRRGIKKWSSTPGQPPNSDTGKLVASILVTRKAGMGSGYAIIKSGGPGAKYAKALEKSKNRNMRRPYFGPMFKKLHPTFVARIKKAMISTI